VELSPRCMLIGAAAVVAVCLVVSWAELVTEQIMTGFLQLPPVALAGGLLLSRLSVTQSRRLSRGGCRHALTGGCQGRRADRHSR